MKPKASTEPSSARLVEVSPRDFSYTLKRAIHREVSDGAIVLSVVGSGSVHLTHVRLLVQSTNGTVHAGWIGVRPVASPSSGGVIGVAPSARPTDRKGMVPAHGAYLQAGRLYSFVATVRVDGGSSSWTIKGIDLTYTENGRRANYIAPQNITVA